MKCEHLTLHFERFCEYQKNNVARSKVNPGCQSLREQSEIIADESVKKRLRNPYGIRIPFLPDKIFKDKYKNISKSINLFPSIMIPDPSNKSCKDHSSPFCSRKMDLERYLVTSDKVLICDMFPVKDSEDSVCRIFYLDTETEDGNNPLCDCRVDHKGEEDHLLPVSSPGKQHTFHDFKVMTDRHHWKNHTGCSESYNCDQYDYLKSVNSQICERKTDH